LKINSNFFLPLAEESTLLRTPSPVDGHKRQAKEDRGKNLLAGLGLQKKPHPAIGAHILVRNVLKTKPSKEIPRTLWYTPFS
jgi:hypothetical protein